MTRLQVYLPGRLAKGCAPIFWQSSLMRSVLRRGMFRDGQICCPLAIGPAAPVQMRCPPPSPAECAQRPIEKMFSSKQDEEWTRVPRVVAARGNFMVLLSRKGNI